GGWWAGASPLRTFPGPAGGGGLFKRKNRNPPRQPPRHATSRRRNLPWCNNGPPQPPCIVPIARMANASILKPINRMRRVCGLHEGDRLLELPRAHSSVG